MAVNWSKYCNKKAYGATHAGADNLQEIEFKSGRRVVYKKNSITKREYDLKFLFDDSQSNPSKLIEGRTEWQWFNIWLDDDLQGLTQSFLFPDILTRQGMKEYKIKSWPTATGQKNKEVNITFIEA